MARIAFIGLGNMGAPMAVNLQRAGHQVRGYNRSPGKTERLTSAGGEAATSIEAAVAGADVVATMLPDSPDVAQVIGGGPGQPGVLDLVGPGTLVIDFSTIRRDVTIDLAEQAGARQIGLLDAPVSGGQAGAEAATLSIMVGGDAGDFERARPILHDLGRTIVHVGDHGAGQLVKAANQLIVAANIEALAEAIVFLDAHDVELEPALEAIRGGLAGSSVLNLKRANMLAHRFDPGFRIELHHKDLGIFGDAARSAGVVTPVGSVVAQLMASARANGDGGLDHSALLRGVERLAGRATG
jgi:2-hydroxy-3-oxopropionate reductase